MFIDNSMILPDTHPALRKKCEPVALPLSKEDHDLLMDLMNHVRASHDKELQEKYNLRGAVGLAAPQIGVNKCMIAVGIPYDEDDDLEFALANPKIVSSSIQKCYLEGGESCLSVPKDVDGYVPRAARITVKGYDAITDQMVTVRLSGYEAIVMQHEIDHLSGTLYYDHIDKNDPFAPIPGAIVI
ncbi:MAG: peptide deformylase [Erysipelotrichaceae bacterium]|nr:peptide deformylase [Erysipelotrichaceae bacterium]